MIQTVDLCKSFGDRHILKNVNVTIKDGELFSVIGPSGIGKSTFIKCIIRLLTPEKGKILVDGQDIASVTNEFTLAKVRRKFGYLFQEGALFDSMNVFENVSFGLKYLSDMPKCDYPKIVKEKLALVGLKDVENLKPAELSVGMKKRVSLARSIAVEPKYILYDEPTTGLDPITTGMVRDLVTDMRNKLGVTSVLVTHDVKLALDISSHIAMLYNGEFVEISEPEKFKQSKVPGVMDFLRVSNITK